MRWLTLSLILATVAAAMGMGWLLDQSYNKINPQSDNDEYRHLIDMSRAYVASHTSSLSEGSSNNNILVYETTIEETLLPQPLIQQLMLGETVVLDSEDTLYLHQLNKQKNTVFNFEIQSPGLANDTGKRLLLTLLFYIGIVILILCWLWPLILSLNSIRKHLLFFGQGQLTQRIKPRRFSYLRDVENGFNQMALRIEQLVEDNRLLGRAVSHDLRTPIARLRFGVDLICDEKKTPAERKKYLDHLNSDLDEMESLVETLLEFAKLEQSYTQIKKEPTDLLNLTHKIAHHYEHASCAIDILCEQKEMGVLTDTRLMSMLLNNVIGNAIQHAKSYVRISLSKRDKNIVFILEDDGLGIADAHLDKVLLPFYRADSRKPGHGMGLAIVARIANWHDAQLTLGKSADLGGLKITLAQRKAR